MPERTGPSDVSSKFLSPQPPVEVGAHKIIIRQLRIAGQYSIDLLQLARREIFGRVDTPAAGEQALPSKDLMQTGDAAGEAVLHVEQGSVGVGKGGGAGEDLRATHPAVDRFKQLGGGACPAGSLAEQ